MSLIQSTGQTSTHAWQRVHDQLSITKEPEFFRMAPSGQMRLQLSHEIHNELISKYGTILIILNEMRRIQIGKISAS